MNPVKEATKAVNDMLKMVGEEPIQLPNDGSSKQRLETLFTIYTDRLLIHCPQYKKIKYRKDIPDLIVIYLNKMIERQ